MTQGLFRQEAIEHQRHILHGDVLLLPKFSHTLLTGILLCWLAAIVIWLATSAYARKETAFGWLEPPSGVIRIYPEDSGFIKSVLVKEGEYVSENQPLVIIDGDRILASGDNLGTQLLDEYETQRKLLNEQVVRTKSIFDNRIQDTRQRIAAAESELQVISQQSSILNQTFDLIKNQVERKKLLRDQGHISLLEFDSAITQELTIKIANDIEKMPMQYKTLVGDMGSSLSGGQKQRIVLARALYREPKILFMDEATSHLDVNSEFAVNQNIQHLKMTRVIVAHRPETVASAGRQIQIASQSDLLN